MYKVSAHTNYYAEAGKVGPVIISVEELEKEQQGTSNQLQLRVLVRTKYDDEWVFIPANKVNKRTIVKAVETQCRFEIVYYSDNARHGSKLSGLKLKKLHHADCPRLLAEMEDKLMSKGYKFGVLYCKQNQTTDDEMFANGTKYHLSLS